MKKITREGFLESCQKACGGQACPSLYRITLSSLPCHLQITSCFGCCQDEGGKCPAFGKRPALPLPCWSSKEEEKR
jgi:hypothetical protein